MFRRLTTLLLLFVRANAFAPRNCNSRSENSESRRQDVRRRASCDDDNTQLIAYLANERPCAPRIHRRRAATAGKNPLGDEKRRAPRPPPARRSCWTRAASDGEQFFTRDRLPDSQRTAGDAADLGYDTSSPTSWNICAFSPTDHHASTTGEGGHGHHTASAIPPARLTPPAIRRSFPSSCAM
jgi:hypothetical protein